MNAADQAFDAARHFLQLATENGFASGRHHENDQRVQHSDDGEGGDEQEPEPETYFREGKLRLGCSKVDLPKEDVNLFVENVES